MSSTNLTDGTSRVCFFMINCDRNRLEAGEKVGGASTVKSEDAKQLSTNLGVSTMETHVKGISVDKSGHRGDGSQRQDMEGIDNKLDRMKRINEEKSKENVHEK